jgi:hypothetical protein
MPLVSAMESYASKPINHEASCKGPFKIITKREKGLCARENCQNLVKNKIYWFECSRCHAFSDQDADPDLMHCWLHKFPFRLE